MSCVQRGNKFILLAELNAFQLANFPFSAKIPVKSQAERPWQPGKADVFHDTRICQHGKSFLFFFIF